MSWQAIQTFSNREARVALELDRLHIEYYLPTYREKRRWSDRKKWIDIPVFSGYLFARFEDDEEGHLRRQICEISGCARIVGIVSDAEIEIVRRLMAQGGRPLDRLDRLRHLAKGESVRVSCGPLTGMEGSLIRHKGKDRLVVSLQTIQRSLITEINIRDVQAIQAAKAA